MLKRLQHDDLPTAFAAALPPSQAPDILARAMALVLGVALALAAWAVSGVGLQHPPMIAATTANRDVVPPVPPPPVEPFELKAVTPQDAVAINAAVPFSTAPNPAARPFVISSAASSYARAVDCLAAAALYEAGSSDVIGQRAVIQVVLNRTRHPAFPKTICGVVFQGQERSTGCQFTFTCDGAMARIPTPDAWERARKTAREALGGLVYKPVGHSTHYHTDWVVPYWSASLDKVTAVGTHLFFRWTGWWGTPGAFRGGYAGSEPAIAKLAGLSEAHRGGAAEITGQLAGGAIVDAANPALLAVMNRDIINSGDNFIIALGRKLSPDQFTGLALAACGGRAYCKVMGWVERSEMPTNFPVDPVLLPAMSYSYLRNRAAGFEKALWNCDQFKRPSAAQCMRRETPGIQPPRAVRTGSVTPPPVTARATAPAPNKAADDELLSITRKALATPAPTDNPAN